VCRAELGDGEAGDRLAEIIRPRARAIWLTCPKRSYCLRIGISSWEGLTADLGGDDEEIEALRRWLPEYRARAWAAGLAEVGIEERVGVPERARHVVGVIEIAREVRLDRVAHAALEPLCVATGSACNSKVQEPSYVLRALGRSDLEAQSAIRFSIGRPTRSADIDVAIERYRNAVKKLRRIAPGRAA